MKAPSLLAIGFSLAHRCKHTPSELAQRSSSVYSRPRLNLLRPALGHGSSEGSARTRYSTRSSLFCDSRATSSAAKTYRSEERRVGKECRVRLAGEQWKEKEWK